MSRRIERILVLSLLIPLSGAVAQEDAAWHFAPGEEVRSLMLSPSGHPLVRTKETLIALNPSTGEILWRSDEQSEIDVPEGLILRREERRASQCEPPELSESDYMISVGRPDDDTVLLVVGAKKVFSTLLAVDAMCEEVKSRIELPLVKDIRAYGSPSPGTLLLYGETAEGRTVLLADWKAGAIKWRRDDLIREKPKVQGNRVFGWSAGRSGIALIIELAPTLTDRGFVLYVSKDGPMLIDTETGQTIWHAAMLQGKDPPARAITQTVRERTLMSDGVLYVPYDGRKLIALAPADGQPLWAEGHAFRGPIGTLDPTEHGLLVRGGRRAPFVEMIDPETGRSVWEFKKLDQAGPFLLGPDTLYLAAKGKFMAIPLDRGAPVELVKLNFKGKEQPSFIEVIDEKFLVASSQNLMLLDGRGTVYYHTYLEAPGDDFLTKLVKADQARRRTNRPGVPAAVRKPLQDMAIDRAISQRYGASRYAERYAYVYTSESEGKRKGFSLVRIDKLTGEEAGRAWFNERKPTYVLDEITGMAFLLKDKREVLAFRFETPDEDRSPT